MIISDNDILVYSRFLIVFEVEMSVLTWKDEYSVGVPLFDDQHKRIFGFMNELSEAIEGEAENDTLKRIIYDLIEYTRTHFRYEEANLQFYGFPKCKQHKQEHDKLTSEIINFALRLFTEPNISSELITFLVEWIKDHILGTDTEYSDFLCEKEILSCDDIPD